MRAIKRLSVHDPLLVTVTVTVTVTYINRPGFKFVSITVSQRADDS
jgi:hypothetical protein